VGCTDAISLQTREIADAERVYAPHTHFRFSGRLARGRYPLLNCVRCSNVFQKSGLRQVALSSFSLQIRRADARTRTGDPFITSDEPVSAPVRASHSRPLCMTDSMDWSGLEVTGEDNLVDGWWTSEMLSIGARTTCADARLPTLKRRSSGRARAWRVRRAPSWRLRGCPCGRSPRRQPGGLRSPPRVGWRAGEPRQGPSMSGRA
jgi:hypothetical protein